MPDFERTGTAAVNGGTNMVSEFEELSNTATNQATLGPF